MAMLFAAVVVTILMVPYLRWVWIRFSHKSASLRIGRITANLIALSGVWLQATGVHGAILPCMVGYFGLMFASSGLDK